MSILGLIKHATIVAAIAISACSNASSSLLTPNLGTDFKFIVIGDTPYTAMDDFMLARAVPLIRDQDYPFIIHLGDYKSSGLKCTPEHDDKLAALMSSLLPKPVFLTPGDNDWADCDVHINPDTGTRYSGLDRLEVIRGRFFSEATEPPKAFNALQQSTLPENQTWTHENIRFFTLHVIGTNNNRDQIKGDTLERALIETTRRDEANISWTQSAFAQAKGEGAEAVVIAMHADVTNVGKKRAGIMCTDVVAVKRNSCDAYSDLRSLIAREVSEFNGPVLLIHGDTGAFTLNQSFLGEDLNNLWRLNAAGDGKYPVGMRDITEVRIDLSSETPFKAKGLTSGIKPN